MTSLRVGILGGGQLSRLLCQAGRRLGLEMRVLAERPTDPAVRFADVFREGSTDDEESVVRFASDCDLLLFENEFVPKPVLEALEPLGARVQPAPPVIGEIQNKLRQKRHFREAGLPTSPFVEREDGETASAFVERARRLLEDRVVLKWAELGYDGKGTCVASSPAEALAFAEDALARGRPLYAEQRVDFVREVALVASRSLRGDLVTWPLVVTRQERGVCREVYGPARLFGVGEVAERELNFWAERTGEKFRLVGTFALEIFEDREGRFWMNELAPRVHNSGHWSLDGAVTSQFENHLRACLGLPLGRAESLYPAFVMRNILGPAEVSRGEPLPRPRVEAAGVSLYWYDKAEVRPGRKMAHLNAVSTEAGELGALRDRLEKIGLEWRAALAKERT